MAINEILRKVLARRGVVTDDEIEKFLNPALGDLAKPDELPGVTGAARAILSAVKRGREIVVFGDYDCDGICATAIMTKTLRALKARVHPFVPERLGEGYGMSEAAVKRMLREHPRVGMVVTVDNGVNSVERVNDLKRRDIEMIVTDHHLPGDTLPNCPVVNPKVLAPPHLDILCGASVAFFVANALMDLAREEGLYDGAKIGGELLVLAGVATITDIMPLLGQNRVIVSESLKRFCRIAPIGLQELYARAARTTQSVLSAKDFGFLIGPRINAAGRIATGMESLELILTDDREKAREAALRVDGRNVERKAQEQSMVDEAIAKLVEGAPAQVIDLSGGHQGVSGIVAARMLERQDATDRVPVCVVVDGRGSARASDGYNVRDAFVAAAETLEDYGGHAAAGGFTVKPGRLEDFRRLFGESCARQRATLAEAGALPEEGAPDVEVQPEDLTLGFAEELRRLEPFGEGNEEPVFRIRDVTLKEVRTVGADGRHLSLVIRKGNERLRAVWWGEGDKVEEYRRGSGIAFDADFHVEISDYQERHVELRLVRLTPVQ